MGTLESALFESSELPILGKLSLLEGIFRRSLDYPYISESRIAKTIEENEGEIVKIVDFSTF